ncbi:MAG: exo-alpha-sialidase [Clostridia bacterium]|nr:exo-alpha-sialidase [Clostridia bacterium]
MAELIKLIGPTKVIISNPGGQHCYFGWPTVERLRNGNIIVGASGYRIEHICPFGKGVIAFSDDEGENYTQPIPVIDTVLDDRDVGLTPFGQAGLIVTSFNNTLEFQRQNMPQTEECFDYIASVSSEDEARDIGVSFRISRDNGLTFGKIYKSPVTSPHGPIVLNDGRILWIGTVYNHPGKIEAYTIDPDDGSLSFYSSIEADGLMLDEPYAIQLPDGKMICHFRIEEESENIFTLYQSVSDDNGKTWSKPKQIIKDDSGAPSHLFFHSSGVLICAFSRRTLPYGIRVILSYDGGESWSDEYTIYENYGSDDLGYPSTVELDDSSLLTVFYARENEELPAVIMQQKWTLENIIK